jgi:phage/plasmid-associated DNA primase
LENLEEKDEDKRDGNKLKLDKWRKECDALLDHKRREKFIKEIICEINNKDIEFDEKPYLFAFKNKIYDLQKCEFVHPNHLDYISLTTGYDYEDNYDKSKIDELDKLIDTIFPEKDVKDFYLCILSTGLEGKTLEKFTIANGGGRNGKGVLNELMLDTVGNYGYVLAANTFNGELKKGNNPELANIYNKRFVNSREPNASIPINTSTMKELTGGDRICTRTNYSEDTHIKLKLTLVFECNKKPLLSNTDTAEIERVEDVPFISTFLSKANYDALDECDRVNKFIGNKFYKEQAFKDQYKQALFEILVKHYQLYTLRNFQLPVSKVIQDRNREYFAGCDGLYQWILENYENTGSDKDRIKIKLLYQEFKNSEYYSNLTKVEKNNYTPKKFQETLQNNMFLKKFITKNKSGVLELRKHALREEDDDSEDEEDDKTPKKEFIDDEDEDEDDEEDDVIEEVVPKKRTVIAESSDDESDDEVVVKKAVKYYVEPNPCRGGD